MMERDVHLKPKDLLASLQFRPGDFSDIALISGQPQRAKMCLKYLEKPVKNFTFLGYTFWTGFYKGRRVTVGNGGFYAPDSAFVTELICNGGVKALIRIGSCGALREDIQIGDFITADKVLRGDGATRYYVDDNFKPRVDDELTEGIISAFKSRGNVHKGGVWTTDAIFRETKEIVNPYIEKGAIGVDMITSPFVTVSNLYKVRAAVIMSVSDNLITGKMGFTDYRYFTSEIKMIEGALEFVSSYPQV